MYNEKLASAILESLDAQFPDMVHFKDLRGRLPEFSDVSDLEWLKVLDTLLRKGFITGVPLREGPGLADLANITITPNGQTESAGLRLRAPQQIAAATQSEDRKFAQLAIDEARKSVAEDDRPHPKVGVVVVKDGRVLARAYRGEVLGCHGEYIALEEKLRDVPLSGATVYTTLEPCSRRNPPKIPCAERLVNRKIGRVVLGILDPDERVHGRGQMRLRKANIATDFFPSDLMAQIEELNRDFIQDRESAVLSTRVSPLEIIFDSSNPARRFWSVESVTNKEGEVLPGSILQYRVEIRNNSSKSVKNVSVTREHVGQMPIRPVDLIFDKTKKPVCDINPDHSELAVVFNWPIPTNPVGLLSGPTAREYGPIKLIASAADTLPTTKVFEFDYQQSPMLRELISNPAAERFVSGLNSVRSPGKIHFVPDRHNHGWARNDGRTDVRAGGSFTYDGPDTLKIVDAFVKGLTSREMWAQSLDVPGSYITRFDLSPHNPLRLVFHLTSDPIAAERGKPMRFQVVFRDVYNQTYELDPVDFPWIGSPVSVAPTIVPTAVWRSLFDRFKAIDVKPIPVWAEWIYTIESKQYEWWVRHSSEVAVKLSIELCKEGGKMLRMEPEFCRRFSDVAAVNDDGDRWLVGLHKVAGVGKARGEGKTVNQGVVTHSENGEIRDLPGASQVLCQMAINGFTE
ncbi:MAG: deaminase [Candidatus Acidiferrales bacterium]